MAITIDNKTYRNLEEQVLKNKEDIARHYEIDRALADWGIKVLGVYASADLLPTEGNEVGDAYAVGTDVSETPYTYYVWTRANVNVGQPTEYWLNIGALSIVGPQGPRGNVGPIGPQGVRGSTWTSNASTPNTASGFNSGDQWLNSSNGDVYHFNGTSWVLQGNIRGPQGVQGPVGPRGIQGIQGPQGAQGPKGDTGASFQIGGLLESSDLLPTPTEANRYIGYAVKNADGVTYDLYVVVGTDTLMWVNMGRVEGVEGPQGPVGPQGPAGADIQVVYITGIPETSTQGTLTQDQVNTLLAHPSNYIQFFNENFYPQDVETDEGYIVYSHVGLYEGNTIVKTITLTLATLSWVLTTINVGEAEPPITIVEELPTANEENFVKGKIYTTGELLKYISKEASEGTVELTNTLPVNIRSTSAAAVGTDIYIFGGFISGANVNTIYKFDTTTGSVSTMSSTLPVGLQKTSAAAVGTDIYIFGGATVNTIYKFDTTTGSVSTMSSTLPVALHSTSAAAVGTDIYIFGGYNGSARVNTIYKFDTTTGSVSTMSSTLPVALSSTSAAAVGTNIYIFGGLNGSGNEVNTIYKFDTTTNSVSTMSSTLGATIYSTSAAAVGTDIYIFGGYWSSAEKRIYKFDTTTGSVSTMSSTLPVALHSTSAAAVGTDIYIFGGENSSYVNTIYKYSLGYIYSYKTITAE